MKDHLREDIEVSQKELLMDVEVLQPAEWPEPSKSNREMILEMALLERMDNVTIAKELGLNRTTVWRVVKKAVKGVIE